jgi:hypothetical protein
MVKSSELRIGNWMTFKGLWKGELSDISSSGLTQFKGNNGCFDIDSIRPIKLMPEILVKAGFDLEYKSVFTVKYTHKNSVFGFDWNITTGWHARYYSHHINCIHLHQLQNLYYALTGEELTIEL